MARLGTASSLLLLFAGPMPPAGQTPDVPAVVLAREARDSMDAVFTRDNERWAEQADLNTMERMLATIRPGTREFLGCLQGRVAGDSIVIERWVPAAGLRQLPLAVTGNCDSVPGLLGTWHTHPFRPDSQNLPLKERELSPQDLATFAGSPDAVVLVMWDVDSLDAAVRRGPRVIHPAAVTVR